MKIHSVKTLIAVGCLTLCEFAFAGVEVRLYVKNSTGAELTSVGACVGGGGACTYDSFTIKNGDEVQIAYTELAVGRTFDIPFNIADNANHYFCTTRIIGQTNDSSSDPKVYSTIQAITTPIEGTDITHSCNRIGDLIKVDKNTVEIHIEALSKTMPLTPPLALPLVPVPPAENQPLESLTPPLTQPLIPVPPANTQPLAPVEVPALEEYIKTDKFTSVANGYPIVYAVTCTDGRSTDVIHYASKVWENDGGEISLSIDNDKPTLEEVRDKIGMPYCAPRASESGQERYYMKTSSLAEGKNLSHDYSVVCLDSKIMPTTFHAERMQEASWTNGSLTLSLPGNDAERINERIYDYKKYLRSYVGERYCGNLPKPLVIPKATSYGRSSKLDKTNTTYTVACANGNTSAYTYDAEREVYSNGVEAYRVKKQRKNDQNYLNSSIAERYCQGSGKLNVEKNVQDMRAGTGTDSFAGVSRIYTVICKKPSSIKTATFWRKDGSEVSWTNVLKTYNLSQSDTALFKKATDEVRYNIILKNVAEPYCAGQ